MGGDDDVDDTRTAIMEATYRALCEHGYASLTMEDIAAEFDKSKSLLHYHFDSKDALFVAFIEYLLAEFQADVASLDGDPGDRLAEFIHRFVVDAGERDALHLALLELRAEAPFNERYREQLAASDELVRQAVTDIIQDGIDEGEFDPEAEPPAVARLVLAAMDGARVRGLTIGDETYPSAVRDVLYRDVLDRPAS